MPAAARSTCRASITGSRRSARRAHWRRRRSGSTAPRRPSSLVGNGAALIRAALPEAWPIVSADAEVDALGVARRALARLAAGERPGAGQEVQPLYLRPPDAHLPAPRPARAGAAVGA